MNKFILRLLLLIMMMPVALQAQSFQFPEGTFRNTTAEDFVAKNLSSKYYNELWTYHVQLQNGVQLVYTFSINDFGNFKDRVTGAKLMVTWKDGNDYIVNKQYHPEQLISSADSTYLRLHKNRTYWAKGDFDGEHILNFETTKDGVSYFANLTFYDIAQGKSIGDGRYRIDNNEIGLKLLVPHAKIKGKVAINGDTLNAVGTGYMDHIYQNNLASEIIDRSYRVKTGNSQNGFYLHFIKLKGRTPDVPIGYGVGFKDGRQFMITPSSIERNKSDGNLDTDISIKPYQMDEFNINITSVLNTYSMLNELGNIQRFLAKRVLGGELIEMYGTAEVNNKEPALFYYLVAK